MTKKEFRKKLVDFFDSKEIDFENSNSTKTLWNWSVKNHDVLNETDLTQELFDEVFAVTPEPEETKDPEPEETKDPEPEETKDPEPEETKDPEEVENVSLSNQLKTFNKAQRKKAVKENTFTPEEEIIVKENKQEIEEVKTEPKNDNTFIWFLIAGLLFVLFMYLKNRNNAESE